MPQIIGIPRDCCKYKTKMISRNALNPIWEETFEIEVHLPELAFARFTVSLIWLVCLYVLHKFDLYVFRLKHK